MKKTKFAVLFTALTAMLGLSSCLGEPDPIQPGGGVCKVDGGFGYYKFKSAVGLTFTPTNPSIITGDLGDFAIISFMYDTRDVSQGTTNIDVELQAPPVPVKTIEYDESMVDYNAPFVDDTYSYTEDNEKRGFFFDKDYMFLSFSYPCEEPSSQEDLSDELKKHHFYLVEEKSEEGEQVDEKTLNLCLVHTVTDSENDERTEIYKDTRYFDLRNVLNGRVPEIININYKVLKSSGDDKELVNTTKPIKLKYKEFVDAINSQQ